MSDYSRTENLVYGGIVATFVAAALSYATAAGTHWWGLAHVHSFAMGAGAASAVLFAFLLIAGIVIANGAKPTP
jgi:hypothetical protein